MRKNRPSSHSSIFAYGALRDVWLVWLTLALLTTLPYVIAAWRSPAGHVFTGVLSAYDDTFTYLTWIRQSADGRLLMCDLYTSEPHSCEFFLPLWNILGITSRVTGMPIAMTFHAARLLSGLLLLLMARAIISRVMKSKNRLRYSLWLYAMSGGLGWLVYAVKNRDNLFVGSAESGSVDLYLPEALAFRSVFAQVHFSLGAALVFGSIKFLVDAVSKAKTTPALAAGLLVSTLALVHPYMVVVVVAVDAIALLFWRLIDGSRPATVNFQSIARIAFAFVATAFPGIAYLFYLNRSNEALREWLRVTDTLSPAPWEYLLGFGVIAILSPFGFRLLWRNRGVYGRVLLVWAAVQAALLYAPLSFQRRLVEGLQLPLSIAASVALFWIARRLFEHRRRLFGKIFIVVVIGFSALTNLGFVAGQVFGHGPAPATTDPRRYVDRDLVEAFRWLSDTAERDSVLVSSYLSGNLAPSMTGLRVFLGHYGQTIASDEKGALINAFYSGQVSDEAARKLFDKHRVRYVLYGPLEKAISDAFTPPEFLIRVHRVGRVEVFKVIE